MSHRLQILAAASPAVRLGSTLRRFMRDRSGAIVLLFALILPLLLFACGAAVDYARRNSSKTQLDAALDAAVLALASRKVVTYDTTMVESARSQFFTEAGKVKGVSNVALTLPIPVTSGTDVSITASYTAKVATTLAKLMSVDSMAIAGAAAASKRTAFYTDLFMALDVSQSMGLAATNAAAKSLFVLTRDKERAGGNSGATGCVFGCHVVQSGSRVTKSYETIANDNSIQLRIDVLRDAVKKTIDTAETDSAGADNYRMALYTMGLASSTSKTWSLNQLSGLSTNFTALRTAANGIDLGPNNGGGTGDTFLAEPLNDLRTRMSLPAGDGTTQAKPKTYLFIITDGVRDVYGSSCTSGHCTGTLDPATCQSFKSQNVTVGVIYTTYLPILQDPTGSSTALEGNYTNLVKPFAADIAPKLQACASPGGWYAEAADGPAIDAALAKMFAQASQGPRLTN